MTYQFLFKKLVFLLVLVLVSCSNNNAKQELSKPVEKEQKSLKTGNGTSEINKTEDKKLNGINKKNAVDFLLKYGELNKETVVLFETRFGEIKLKLYEDTPIHRANFIFLTKTGYFDTTCFYRVVPGFIIQGGNSERISTVAMRHEYNDYTIPAEFVKRRKHKYGALAAARDWENNPHKRSMPFEFYIIQNRKGAHHLDGEHTVYGQVISGFDVIDKIVNLEAGGDEWPLDDVFIKASVLY